MKKNETEGFSLWFMPTGDLYEELKELIDRLAEEHGAPPFLPHLTLLGTVTGPEKEIIEKTSLLASELTPFDITLKGVGTEEAFFRCLFLKAAKDRVLMETNEKARALFHKEEASAFMPHLSLMYGDFTPARKAAVIADAHLSDFAASFRVESLHLFSTPGPSERWRHTKEFPFL